MRWVRIFTVLWSFGAVFAAGTDAARKVLWSGWWQTGSGKPVPFAWLLSESTECCAVWNIQVTGTARDVFGDSQIAGSCGDGVCTFTQVYRSGRFKGRTYIYEGKPELSADSGELRSVGGEYQWRNRAAKGKFRFDKFLPQK